MKLRFVGGPRDNQMEHADPSDREWIVPIRDHRNLAVYRADEQPPTNGRPATCRYQPARIAGEVVMVHACGDACAWREIEAARKAREARSGRIISAVFLDLMRLRLRSEIRPPEAEA